MGEGLPGEHGVYPTNNVLAYDQHVPTLWKAEATVEGERLNCIISHGRS